MSAIERMIDLSLPQLDKSYAGDSTIELFYRNNVRRQPPVTLDGLAIVNYVSFYSKYRDLFISQVVDVCVANPKAGILDAATQALNNSYAYSKANSNYAICKAYNEEEFSFAQFFTSDHSMLISLDNTGAKHPTFGVSYVQELVSKSCISDPVQPLHSAMATAIDETKTKINKERMEKMEADWKRGEERLEQEELKRRVEIEQRRQADLKKYSISLYKNSDGGVLCEDYAEQAALHYSASNNHALNSDTVQSANDARLYKEGLENTLKDAINRLKPDEKEFLLSRDYRYPIEVQNYCYKNPSDSLELAIKLAVDDFPSLVKERKEMNASLEAFQKMTPEERTALKNEEKKAFQQKLKASGVGNAYFRPFETVDNIYAPPSSETAPTENFNRAAVIKDPDGYVNMRDSGSSKGEVIARLQNNETVLTYDQKDPWWQIQKPDGLVGYVHESRIALLGPLGELITKPAASPETESVPPVASKPTDPFNRVAVINDPDGYTNVRDSAVKGKIISRVLENERFSTYEQEGAWWRVRKTDGLVGYVHKSRITLLP